MTSRDSSRGQPSDRLCVDYVIMIKLHTFYFYTFLINILDKNKGLPKHLPVLYNCVPIKLFQVHFHLFMMYKEIISNIDLLVVTMLPVYVEAISAFCILIVNIT